MKGLCQKRNVRLFFEVPERVWRLDATDPDPNPLILRKIYATAGIRASGVAKGVVGAATPQPRTLRCTAYYNYSIEAKALFDL